MITVNKLNDTTYEAKVAERIPTTHKVTLTASYYQKLTGGKVTPEKLIEASFTFLLEREPNTSILRSFNLSVIGHYFPEYEGIIEKMI